MATSDAVALLHALRLEDGRKWGDTAVARQRADAAAVLDLSGPRLHFITRPRGGSKTTDEGAAALAVLLEQAPAGSRSYAVAVDKDQAALLHDALAGFVARSPALGSVLDVRATEAVNRNTGAALEVLPADGASAWGLRPYLFVVDELAAWPSTPNHRRLFEAIVSAIPKMPNSRLVIITSAGDPGHWSYKVLQSAKASPRWRVSEMPGPLPWWSQEDLDEQRNLLTESAYARLILNRWTALEGRLATADAVRACVGHDGVIPPARGVRYVVTLDVGLTNDATVAVVAHAELAADGSTIVVVDRIDRWRGRKGAPVDLVHVETHLAELAAAYNGARVVFDPFQAVAMAQSLRRRGVRAEAFNFTASSVGKLGLALYRSLRDGQLDLPDDDELLDELASVQLRESSPGVYRLDHDAGKHDDQAIALALAVHSLLEVGRVGGRRRSVHIPESDRQPEDRVVPVGSEGLEDYLAEEAKPVPGIAGLEDYLGGPPRARPLEEHLAAIDPTGWGL